MEIFVSRPTDLGQEFQEGLKVFLTCLMNMDIKPRTLGASDYPTKAPLDEVIEVMEQCQGAIILGYPQIVITSGQIKSQEVGEKIHLPTEWNHIEAVLAYSKNLPIMLIHHRGIRRGIFDRGVMNAFLHETDMTKESWCMDTPINGALTKWKHSCLEGKPNFPPKSEVRKDVPLCPNCSTASKSIYLTKLPSDMKRFGTWLCSKCNYME